jgi:geranylgeranyl diphosphate synthase, type II
MSHLQRLGNLFQNHLADHRFKGVPETLYEPADYFMALGGKRMRPILALMGYELYKKDVQMALPAAMAVEVLHNFSLVHDDIMDEAPLRRGQTTLHIRNGLNTAILTGDMMMLSAFDHISACTSEHVQAILKLFTRTSIEICEGQQYDMDFESRDEVALPEYIRMIELKTSVLLACALKMGAILGDAPAGECEHLYQFGRLLGIAFQIQDDYLDTFGNPELVGKQPGGDILQNKKTWLVSRFLEVADLANAAAMRSILGGKTEDPELKIASVKALFQQYSIPEQAKEAQLAYQNEAFEHLDQINVPLENKAALYEMTEMLMHRHL